MFHLAEEQQQRYPTEVLRAVCIASRKLIVGPGGALSKGFMYVRSLFGAYPQRRSSMHVEIVENILKARRMSGGGAKSNRQMRTEGLGRKENEHCHSSTYCMFRSFFSKGRVVIRA